MRKVPAVLDVSFGHNTMQLAKDSDTTTFQPSTSHEFRGPISTNQLEVESSYTVLQPSTCKESSPASTILMDISPASRPSSLWTTPEPVEARAGSTESIGHDNDMEKQRALNSLGNSIPELKVGGGLKSIGPAVLFSEPRLIGRMSGHEPLMTEASLMETAGGMTDSFGPFLMSQGMKNKGMSCLGPAPLFSSNKTPAEVMKSSCHAFIAAKVTRSDEVSSLGPGPIFSLPRTLEGMKRPGLHFFSKGEDAAASDNQNDSERRYIHASWNICCKQFCVPVAVK